MYTTKLNSGSNIGSQLSQIHQVEVVLEHCQTRAPRRDWGNNSRCSRVIGRGRGSRWILLGDIALEGYGVTTAGAQTMWQRRWLSHSCSWAVSRVGGKYYWKMTCTSPTSTLVPTPESEHSLRFLTCD
jgi:hypothetical protein